MLLWLVVLTIAAAACRGSAAPAPVQIRLVTAPNSEKAVIEVGDLPDELARQLAAGERSRGEWAEILRVSVAEGQPAMVGYTVFFDPGRQKRGILPNQQMGRSLEPGRRYALVVAREWRDANGAPLKEAFRREFTVSPADERPLDVSRWRITPPAAGTQDALAVEFPEPLDHGLLLRALGVTGEDGRFLEGDVRIDSGESRWSLTPRSAWQAGAYHLVALAMLEDLAGNRIGRAFEVDRFDRADSSQEVERTTIPFRVGNATLRH